MRAKSPPEILKGENIGPAGVGSMITGTSFYHRRVKTKRTKCCRDVPAHFSFVVRRLQF